MKRAIQFAAMGLLLSGSGAWAQVQSTTKVGLSVEGVYFYVDGRQFNSTQIFLWPEGSKHTIQFLLSVEIATGLNLPYQAGNFGTVQYALTNWVTNGPILQPNGSSVLTVTASPAVTSIVGQLQVSYKLRFLLYNTNPLTNVNCLGAPADAPPDGIRAGIIYLDSTCIGDTTDLFVPAGIHTLNAFPYPGFVFTGWFFNNNGQVDKSFLTSINVTTNGQIIPQFMPAKRVHFATNPLGLKVIIDRTVIQTPPKPPQNQLPSSNIDPTCSPDYSRLGPGAPPGIRALCVGDFDFLPGSSHLVGTPPTQQDDTGKWWVFSGFSNGMSNNSLYTADQNPGAVDSLTANFVPGYPVTMLTVPPGLKLEVDGSTTNLSYNFIWAAGDKHTVTAAPSQSARGRKFQFGSWSNSGSRIQQVTVPADSFGLTLTARYDILGQVQLNSNPQGLKISVDGQDCTTPCLYDQPSGNTMNVAAPSIIPSTALARYDFDNWGAQSTPSLNLTFNSDVQVLNANYHASYLVAANSDPPGAVTFKYDPPSADGFYPEGVQVTVTATANGGYKFRRWDGDLAGTFSTGYLKMDGPRSVLARLDKVPFIPPAGVKNAAGDTPDGSVAPGSIISIYGENLAAGLTVGPVNPLAQTLGDVTVTVSDRLLPLLFVSPKQINAQVPTGLSDGVYPLKVNIPGQSLVTGSLKLRRNAPGLFTMPNDHNAPLALAFHEDGSPITPDSPARRREVVSIIGTGFGPFDRPVIEGFLIPDPSLYKLLDPVAVQAGDLTLTPEWTGPASTTVGATVMKLRIADEMPQASTIDLTVTINGAQSNKVQLAVE